MRTICPNESCSQAYKIKEEMIGRSARCKKCNSVFEIKEYKESDDSDISIPSENNVDKGKKRKTKTEIIDEQISTIKRVVNEIIPRLEASLKRNENESDTRLLINKMLQRVLGYSLEEIKTEQKVEGRRADYVIYTDGQPIMVIEAKKIGMNLRDRHLFQATSYAAYSGIPWAVMTNGILWQLYRVSTGEKIETDLVFTIDLRNGIDDEEAYNFFMISKSGFSRKGILDKAWQKISALCYDNIVNCILTDDVIAKIRTTLSKRTGYKMTNDELRNAIEENILQLS